jgi:hypothetical protein
MSRSSGKMSRFISKGDMERTLDLAQASRPFSRGAATTSLPTLENFLPTVRAAQPRSRKVGRIEIEIVQP